MGYECFGGKKKLYNSAKVIRPTHALSFSAAYSCLYLPTVVRFYWPNYVCSISHTFYRSTEATVNLNKLVSIHVRLAYSLFNTMNPGQLNPWLALQDVIGPASTFPPFIRRFFWKRELYNRERFSLALFGWMNGVNPVFLLEVLIFCGCNLTADRQAHNP